MMPHLGCPPPVVACNAPTTTPYSTLLPSSLSNLFQCRTETMSLSVQHTRPSVHSIISLQGCDTTSLTDGLPSGTTVSSLLPVVAKLGAVVQIAIVPAARLDPVSCMVRCGEWVWCAVPCAIHDGSIMAAPTFLPTNHLH